MDRDGSNFQSYVHHWKIQLGVYNDLHFPDTLKCADGFFAHQNKYCLKVFRNRKTWSDAMKECFKYGSKLFAPAFISTTLESLNKIQGANAFRGTFSFRFDFSACARWHIHTVFYIRFCLSSLSLCLSVSVSVCLCLSFSVSLSVCLSVCLSLSLSVCPPFSVSLCLSVSL